MTATTEPTIAEQLLALETTAHRLATERDHALIVAADTLEAACRLQQERDREKARADEQAAQALTQAALAARFRNRLEEVHTELRQTRDTCRNLAVAHGALEQQAAQMRDGTPPGTRRGRWWQWTRIERSRPERQPDDHTRRQPFRRGDNSL